VAYEPSPSCSCFSYASALPNGELYCTQTQTAMMHAHLCWSAEQTRITHQDSQVRPADHTYKYTRPQTKGQNERWPHQNTRPFNSLSFGTTQVSRYQKGKTNLDFTEARDSEWSWNPLGHMQVCTSLQTDNHASTPPLSFLQAGCPSCRPTNSVKALKASEHC